MPVESPCVRLCTLDARDVCIGCGRTLDEICGWTAMDDAEQRRVIASAAERKIAQRAGREAGRG